MRRPGPFLQFARYGALAFEFSGTIAAGAVLGNLVDRWQGTQPYGVTVGTLVAVVGGFARFIAICPADWTYGVSIGQVPEAPLAKPGKRLHWDARLGVRVR